MTIEPTSPWISYAVRRPTKEDADKDRCVVVIRSDGSTSFAFWDSARADYLFWMPIPPLPAPKKLSRREQDENEFDCWFQTLATVPLRIDAWHASAENQRRKVRELFCDEAPASSLEIIAIAQGRDGKPETAKALRKLAELVREEEP